MTGKRKEESALPPRMYAFHGKRTVTYYAMTPENHRVNLGHDLKEAEQAYAALFIGYTPEVKDHETVMHLYRKAVKGARSRNIDFKLTQDDVREALHAAGGRCAVTGMRFSNATITGKKIRPYMPSVDRVDSSRGYAPGNIRIVCTLCNIAMNQFGEGALLGLLSGMLEKMQSNVR